MPDLLRASDIKRQRQNLFAMTFRKIGNSR
jgi:hypothetical protein